MPVTSFVLQWPDGRVLRCSSPSLVVHEHLEPGSTHSVAQVLVRTRVALHEADARVRRLLGHPCSMAAAALQAVETAAERYALHEPVLVRESA